MKNFFDTVLPTATDEQMVNAFAELIKEANEESKKLAETDPMLDYASHIQL